MEKLHEEVIKNIRACLISSKGKITVRQLEDDYRTLTGERIPYGKLGSKNLEEFLASVPTLVLSKQNGNIFVDAKVSPKSSHIVDMVQKQKPASRKIFKREADRFTSNISPSNVRPYIDVDYLTKCDTRLSIVSDNQLVERKRPSVASHVVSRRRSALNIIHEHIGKNNSRTTSKKTEVLDRLGVKSQNSNGQSSAHIVKASDQNTMNDSSNEQGFIKVTGQEHAQHEVVVQEKAVRINEPAPNKRYRRNEPMPSTRKHKIPLPMPSSSNKLPPVMPGTSNHKVPLLMSSTSDQKIPPLMHSTSNHNIPPLVPFHPNQVDGDEITIKIPKDVQNNLKTLIFSHPKGVWCGELLEKYRQKFRKRLTYADYGYKSLISMCMDLPEIFHIIKPHDDFKLYDSRLLSKEAERSFTMPSNSVKQTTTHNIEKPRSELQTHSFDLPIDVVLNDEMPREFVPDNIKEGDYLEVVVADIYDISKFWIHLRNTGLDNLVDKLQVFYEANYDKYRMPDALIHEGHYCVCKFHNEYHRALIVKVYSDRPEVKVFYADYGTVAHANRETVCYLVKDFCDLPFQSIRCRLASIYPPMENITWSQEAIDVFFDLVSGRDIVAQINKILHEKQTVDLYLIDRDTNECINDALVEKKAALYTNQERSKALSDSGLKPVVKYLHLFPSFLDMELGLAPSRAEFDTMINMGITFDLIYPQYFSRQVDEDIIPYIDKQHDEDIAKAEEEYKKGNLLPKLTFQNIMEIQHTRSLDLSLFDGIGADFYEHLPKNTQFVKAANKNIHETLNVIESSKEVMCKEETLVNFDEQINSNEPQDAVRSTLYIMGNIQSGISSETDLMHFSEENVQNGENDIENEDTYRDRAYACNNETSVETAIFVSLTPDTSPAKTKAANQDLAIYEMAEISDESFLDSMTCERCNSDLIETETKNNDSINNFSTINNKESSEYSESVKSNTESIDSDGIEIIGNEIEVAEGHEDEQEFVFISMKFETENKNSDSGNITDITSQESSGESAAATIYNLITQCGNKNDTTNTLSKDSDNTKINTLDLQNSKNRSTQNITSTPKDINVTASEFNPPPSCIIL